MNALAQLNSCWKKQLSLCSQLTGRYFAGAVLLLLVFCFLAPVSYSQTANTGAVAGTVTDTSNAVVNGAAVAVTNKATGETRHVVSENNGTYLVPQLPPGAYSVQVSKSGFKEAIFPAVTVNVTETERLNVRLAVGEASEHVTVTANAEQLQTETSALGHVVSGDQIRSLPLVTRNYTQILGLSPGVSADVFNAGELGRGGVDDNLVSGGSVTSDNNFQMNGVEINDLEGSGRFSGGPAIPNPDAIEEFKVQTSQYDASYGRDAGANVDVVTKSGTNAFHGSLWEFFRNEDLNANDPFRVQTKQPRPILRQNQFGFTFGGPVLKDKFLIFTSYQGTRQRNGVDPECSSNVVLPPITDDRSPAALANALDSLLGLPPGTLPAGALVPQAVAIFNFKLPNGQFLVPTPQTLQPGPTPGSIQGFSTFSLPCTYNEDQFVTNFDYLQSEKSKIGARFFFSNSQQDVTLPTSHFLGDTIPGSPQRQPNQFRNLSLTHTYIFNSQLVNQAEFGFHRTDVHISQEVPFHFSDLGITAPGFINTLPVIDVQGGFNIGGNGQATNTEQNTFVYQDGVSWVRGKHSFKFGGGLTRVQNNISLDFAGFLGFLNYPLLFTPLQIAPGLVTQAPLVEDIAGDLGRHFRIWDGNLYAQDDYKVTPRLTVNLGFRYERLGDFSDADGRTATIDPSKVVGNPPPGGSLAGIVVASNFRGTIPAGVVRSGNDLAIKGNGQNTLNPRLGFAWRLPKTERIVLRGGYGVFHERLDGQPYLQQLTNQPFALIQAGIPNLAGSLANPFLGDPGAFPQFIPYTSITDPASTGPQSVFTLAQNIQPPIYQRYSLNLQTQIAKDFVLEVGYVGARGQHLTEIRSLNQALAASPSAPINGETTNTLANVQLRAPFQGFTTTNFQFVESNGASWYNSLQTSLSKRFSHGLQLLASYTFARDLSTVTTGTTGANGGTILGDQNNFRDIYGPDDFVREHRFILSGVYDFPSPQNRNSALGELIGGWQLSGVSTIQSGRRLTITNFNPTNVFGSVNDFAQLVAGCDPNLSTDLVTRLDKFFNTSCFTTAPVIGTDGVGTGFGNSPVGLVHGPGQVNTDLSLLKNFGLRWPNEGANVQFRTDFFNAFNHPQFDIPDVELTSPTFGQVTNTVVNPRVIQFALKVSF